MAHPPQKPRIGLFLRGGDHAYPHEIVWGAHHECVDEGVDLYCFAGGRLAEPDPHNVVYELTSAEQLDGAILVPGTMAAGDGPDVRALVGRLAGTATCSIGEPLPGLTTPCVADDGSPPGALGRRAVRLVLAMGAGRSAADPPALLPAEPGRQPSLPRAIADSSPGPIEARRHEWIEVVIRSSPPRGEPPDDDRDDDFARRLVDALIGDLSRDEPGEFAMVVDGVARQSAESCNVPAWHRAITALRAAAVHSLAASPDAWRRAEAAFERAHRVVGALAERERAQRRLRREAAQQRLLELGADARAAVDLSSLQTVLGRHLPELRIPSLYVCVPDERSVGSSLARLLVAYDDEAGIRDVQAAAPFPWDEVIPVEHRPHWRHSLVVEPLVSDERVLGLCAMELGTRDGPAFRAIAQLIGTALRHEVPGRLCCRLPRRPLSV